MKKIIYLMGCMFLTHVSWSQDLYVGATGVVRIAPTAFVYAGGAVTVNGDLTADSDATDSASFLAKGAVTGNISYKRYVKDANFHLIATPVTTQEIAAFAENGTNNVADNGIGADAVYGIGIYKNDNAKGSRWVHYLKSLATGTNFESGSATANKRTAAGTFTYTGNMATSDVSITIPAHTTGPFVAPTGINDGTHVWSAVGNPYPSFIAANANGSKEVDLLNTNITNNILAHNLDKLNALRAYLYVWNGTGYEIINHSSPSFILAPGQGFLVDPKGYDQVFEFLESDQTVQPAAVTTFYKTTPTPFVNVHLSNGSTTKKTVLKYFSNTTVGLDVGWDAGSFAASSFSIDTHLVKQGNGIDFALQCLPNSNYEASIVPLAVNAVANTGLTFTSDAVGLPEGIKVYLEDKVANTITDITTASYEVTPSIALSGIGRFYLHTTSNILSVDAVVNAPTLNVYKTSNRSIRITGLTTKGNTAIKMYSVTGKLVFTKQFVSQNISDVVIPERISTGVYVVSVVSNTVKLNKKVLIE
jgi:hypothetical protein